MKSIFSKHKQSILISLFCIFSISLTINIYTDREPILAIQKVSVFDSIEGKMLRPQTVVIKGNRIMEVGDTVNIPLGALVIDGKGQYLIPGLIDAHVHIDLVYHKSERSGVYGEKILPIYLSAGVTSIRSAGDAIEGSKKIAEYVEDKPEITPRVFLASPLIDGDPPYHTYMGLGITDTSKIPKLINDLKEMDIKTLKIYVGASPEVGKKVIKEGNRHDLVVSGHLSQNYPTLEAVSDGLSVIEHIWGIFNFIIPPEQNRYEVDLKNPLVIELIDAITENNVAVVPTLAVFRNMILLGDQPEYNQHPDVDRMPETLKTHW